MSTKFQDTVDRGDEWNKKVWVTKSAQNSTLFEYANKTMYRIDTPTNKYNLQLPFSVCYQNSFASFFTLDIIYSFLKHNFT